MVMTFVLHPLSHYNSITEPRARFCLSLLEDLSIDFPSHFILSFIDVYRDTMICDELIFPLAITQIIRHFSIPYPEMMTPLAFLAPSTSAPSSFASGVTLDEIMTQLQRMDALLDTLSDELCQVNTHVGHIARQ